MSTDDDTGGAISPLRPDIARLDQEVHLLREVKEARASVQRAEEREAPLLETFQEARKATQERTNLLSLRLTEHARFVAIKNAEGYGDLLVDYLQERVKALIPDLVPGDVKVTAAREIWGPDRWWREQWHDDTSKTLHVATAIFEVEVKKGDKTELLTFALEHAIGSYEDVRLFMYKGRVNYETYNPMCHPRFEGARELSPIPIVLRKLAEDAPPSPSLTESWSLAGSGATDDWRLENWRKMAETSARRLDAIRQGSSILDHLRGDPDWIDSYLTGQLRGLLKDVANEPRISFFRPAVRAAKKIMRKLSSG